MLIVRSHFHKCTVRNSTLTKFRRLIVKIVLIWSFQLTLWTKSKTILKSLFTEIIGAQKYIKYIKAQPPFSIKSSHNLPLPL